MTGKAGRLEGQLGPRDLTVHCLGCRAADLPANTAWLAPTEARTHAGFRIDKRRRDWLLGRWTAKRAVAAFRDLLRLAVVPMQAIEIRADPDGAPRLFVGGAPPTWTLSISHSSDRALCALVASGVPLGCDIERIEPRNAAFVEDYFTAAERERVAAAGPADRPILCNLIWSAKESALKALRTGLRSDTRSVEAVPGRIETKTGVWRPLRVVEISSAVEFTGWWRASDGFVETVAALGAAQNPPIELTR